MPTFWHNLFLVFGLFCLPCLILALFCLLCFSFLFFSLFCLLSWGQQIFSGDYFYTCEVFFLSLLLGYYIVSYPYHIIYLASISSYVFLFLSLKKCSVSYVRRSFIYISLNRFWNFPFLSRTEWVSHRNAGTYILSYPYHSVFRALS